MTKLYAKNELNSRISEITEIQFIVKTISILIWSHDFLSHKLLFKMVWMIFAYVHGRSYGEFADFHQIHNSCLPLFLLSLYISPYIRKLKKLSANILIQDKNVDVFCGTKVFKMIFFSDQCNSWSKNYNIKW